MNTELKIAGKEDINELKALWLSCFDDSPEAADLFFERNKNTYHAYAATENGKIVSALYLIDCTLGGAQAHYLCGAATLPDFRNRGIMGKLIEYSLNDAKNRGDRFSVLLPASGKLYRFYGKHGYRACCSVRGAMVHRNELERGCADSILVGDTADFEYIQYGFKRGNFLLWNNDYVRFAIEYYACYGIKTAFSKNAMAIFEEENGVCNVFYCAYNDLKELKTLLLGSSDSVRFVVYGKCGEEFFDISKKEKYGMAKALSTTPLPKDIYIGITLS